MNPLLKFKCYLLFAVLMVYSPIVQGDYSGIRFRRITINDGLSLSSVYCIFQDSKGFMWFGTEDGLNRYDGRNFTIYRPIPGNQNSITHRWIELIYEDRNGILWFGSCRGLTRFDPVHETFSQYHTGMTEPYHLLNDTISVIEQVSDELLLVGTFGGLFRITLPTGECNPIFLPSLPDYPVIRCIKSLNEGKYLVAGTGGAFQVDGVTGNAVEIGLEDEAMVTNLCAFGEKIWIGTENGIFWYNREDAANASGVIATEKLHETSGISVEQMLPDETLNLWISSRRGLYKTEPSGKTSLIVPSEKKTHSLALIPGNNLQPDANRYIWYATHGDGIYRINLRTNETSNFKNNPCDPESLSENAINCIYYDLSGSLWFGTFGAGISVYNPSSQKFTLLRRDPITSNTLASNFVWTIFEDHKGRIWIGSNDKGISVYSPQTETFRHYDNEPGNPRSLSHSSVRKIYEDSENITWIGTDGGGLNKFDEKSGSFIHYVSDPDNPVTLSDNSVRVIYEDKSGMLWIGTRNGLNRFDKGTNTFTRYLHSPDDTNSISHNFIYSAILQDSKGNLWIGTYGGGLNKMNIEKEKFQHYRYNPDNPNSISNDVVFSIYEDKAGILWIGTNSGLNRFNPKTGRFSRFGIKQGLPNEVIYGVVPDNSGNLWLSTNYGICRFNPTDSSTTNFDYTHGLQSNEFNGGAFHRGRSGRLYFGGVYGLNSIDPDAIGEYKDHSKMIISRLEVMGREVNVLPPTDSKSIRNRVIKDSINYFMQENISYAGEIILDYYNRSFSLEFVDLGNINSTHTNYDYILEGLDENWHNSGTRNYVSYAKIPPGNYRFNVKSKKPDGSWNQSVATLNIVITPPFWLKWWFIVIEILVAFVIAFSIYRYLVKIKTYRILRIQNERVNTANKKLIKSEQNLKLINATKDKFFSIIAHDLKNPFTSLLSISETMNENFHSFEEEEKQTSMQKIHGSIKNIYSLLENLLTWSRTQTGRIRFNPEKFNISQLLHQNCILYEHAATKKNIKLIRKFEEDILAYGDQNMIDTVIRNLLNNALKFTPAEKSVEIGVLESDRNIEVYISDQGVGISAEDRQKLFRIDQKIKTAGTGGEKGTGLGLIICKEFIEKNKGAISVISEPGQGSTFRVTLPKEA